MDETTSLTDAQLVLVVAWNVVFGLPLLVGAATMIRRRAFIAAACAGLYLALLLLLPALYARWVNYVDGSEPVFKLVGLYFAAWIAVAILGGAVLLPLTFVCRRPSGHRSRTLDPGNRLP